MDKLSFFILVDFVLVCVSLYCWNSGIFVYKIVLKMNFKMNNLLFNFLKKLLCYGFKYKNCLIMYY